MLPHKIRNVTVNSSCPGKNLPEVSLMSQRRYLKIFHLLFTERLYYLKFSILKGAEYDGARVKTFTLHGCSFY
jgi:hypothetical protein